MASHRRVLSTSSPSDSSSPSSCSIFSCSYSCECSSLSCPSCASHVCSSAPSTFSPLSSSFSSLKYLLSPLVEYSSSCSLVRRTLRNILVYQRDAKKMKNKSKTSMLRKTSVPSSSSPFFSFSSFTFYSLLFCLFLFIFLIFTDAMIGLRTNRVSSDAHMSNDLSGGYFYNLKNSDNLFRYVFSSFMRFIGSGRRNGGSVRGKTGGLFLYAEAWDAAAHEAIGMTAMSALKAKALTQIRRLTGGKDVVDISSWADRVAEKYPLTESLHFQKQKPWECGAAAANENNCREGRCIVNAIKHFYSRLSGREVPKAAEGGVEYIEFVYPSSIKLTDADAVKFLVNLIGDLHQPLHLGFESDDCGRKTIGSLVDSQLQNTTLYSIWEKDIVDKIIRERPYFWNSGWTHVNSIKAFYEKERVEFAAERENMFDRWASETITGVCEKVYVHPQTGEKFIEETSDKNADNSPKFTLNASAEFYIFEFIKQQILLAGARTAIVLNDIFENREIGAGLRVGTGISDVPVDNEETVASAAVRPLWIRNFLINLTIIIVVLGVFVYVTRFYSPSSTFHPSHSHSSDAVNKKEKEEEMKVQKLPTKGRDLDEKDS